MALTNEMVSAMLIEVFETDFDSAEVERLRPLIERHLERMRQLQDLDLGNDPRAMAYITDHRLQP
ncbi:MAG TPA: hypothetical protein VGK54_14275 [Chloroflexota bacterium]|jgi:hypothetical protein